jgi:hypothetical protein
VVESEYSESLFIKYRYIIIIIKKYIFYNSIDFI